MFAPFSRQIYLTIFPVSTSFFYATLLPVAKRDVQYLELRLSSRTLAPVLGLWINRSFPDAMPVCQLRPDIRNATMSPGFRLERLTGLPKDACSLAVRGIFIPCWAKLHCKSPEQSNPVRGNVPPILYLTPICERAVASTASARPFGCDAGTDGMVRLPQPGKMINVKSAPRESSARRERTVFGK